MNYHPTKKRIFIKKKEEWRFFSAKFGVFFQLEETSDSWRIAPGWTWSFCQHFCSRRFLLRFFSWSFSASPFFFGIEGAPFCRQLVGMPCPYASRRGEWVSTFLSPLDPIDYRFTLASKGNETKCDEKWKQLVFFFEPFFWGESKLIANQMIFQGGGGGCGCGGDLLCCFLAYILSTPKHTLQPGVWHQQLYERHRLLLRAERRQDLKNRGFRGFHRWTAGSQEWYD